MKYEIQSTKYEIKRSGWSLFFYFTLHILYLVFRAFIPLASYFVPDVLYFIEPLSYFSH